MRQSSTPLSLLGKKIDEIRTEKNIVLGQMAKDAQLNYSQVWRIMHGHSNPVRESVTKLCHALHCTQQERRELFHAAGYYLADDEEPHAA